MALLATMAVSLTACGTSGGSSSTSGEMNTSSAVQSTGITITDSAGREVTLEKPLETVVTFNSSVYSLSEAALEQNVMEPSVKFCTIHT